MEHGPDTDGAGRFVGPEATQSGHQTVKILRPRIHSHRARRRWLPRVSSVAQLHRFGLVWALRSLAPPFADSIDCPRQPLQGSGRQSVRVCVHLWLRLLPNQLHRLFIGPGGGTLRLRPVQDPHLRERRLRQQTGLDGVSPHCGGASSIRPRFVTADESRLR